VALRQQHLPLLFERSACLPGQGVALWTTKSTTAALIQHPFVLCALQHCCCSSPTDIQPGQGLYYEAITKSWRATNCDGNSYGVTNKTYGLTPAPCKACPSNMVASANATAYPRSAAYYTRNEDNTGGFTSVMACVTTAGE